MINKIQLWNFQIHKKLYLELDRVTTFVGPNDSGKTAVLRALYWLCFGKPLGEEFIHYGADYCRVSLELDGGRCVDRRRANSTSSYRLRDLAKGTAEVFKALGTSVPEQVQQLLNVSAINFQRQLDAPLWMLESAGQLSKHLNEIVNLQLMDNTVQKVSSQIRKAKTEIELVEERITTLERQVERLFFVTEMDNDVSAMEDLEAKLVERRERGKGLRKLVNRAKVLTQRKNTLTEASKRASELAQLANKLRTSTKQRKGLAALVQQVGHLAELASKTAPDTEELATDNAALIVHEVETKVARQDRKHLDGLVTEVQMLDYLIGTRKEKLAALNKKLERQGNRCPLCGQTITESSQSSAETCTSHTPPPSAGRKRASRGTR